MRSRLFENDSEVIPGLFMGSPPGSWDLAWERFDIIVSMISMGPIGYCPEGKLWIVYPLQDAELPEKMKMIEDLALFLADQLDDEKRILVHCGAGLNRSGLICVLIVRKTTRCSGSEAVDLVRAARGPIALSNPYFSHYLTRRQAPL